MRTLAFDPGAERCGWAVIDREVDGPREITSGILGLNRGDDEGYQEYRVRLIVFWIAQAVKLLDEFKPDKIASEIVPPVGGNVANNIQRQLALTVITTIQSVALYKDYTILEQMGASTIKKFIGGSGSATKVAVRNGVYKLIPDTRKYKFTKVFDQSDALAVALVSLGYEN